jgi:hypothetical protein
MFPTFLRLGKIQREGFQVTIEQNVEVLPADFHVVTAQEAIEPLFRSLELEAEAKLVSAARAAGWSPEEAIDAIDELRRKDILSALADGHRSE